MLASEVSLDQDKALKTMLVVHGELDAKITEYAAPKIMDSWSHGSRNWCAIVVNEKNVMVFMRPRGSWLANEEFLKSFAVRARGSTEITGMQPNALVSVMMLGHS